MTQTFRAAFLLMVAALCAVYFAIPGRADPYYAGLHFAIVVLALCHLLWLRTFGLGASFSFFALFFFGLIPLFEYKLQISYNATSLPHDDSYTLAAVLALLSSIFFYAGYGRYRNPSPQALTPAPIHYVSRRHHQLMYAAGAAIIAASALFIGAYHEFDLNRLMFRGFAEEVEQSAFGYSFINFFLRPLLFNLFLLAMLLRATRTSPRDLRVWGLFALTLLFISPLGIPRTLAGALYIPLLLLVFLPRWNSKYAVLCVIVFGVLFAAPIFDIFRLVQLGDPIELGANFNLDYLFAGHFDAFYNLALVIQLRFESEGWQTIGALLFWVPRALWPGKPVGTSFDFAEFAGLRASNVSFPLTADLYIDFGIVGVALGMFLLGIVYRRIDSWFSRPRPAGSLASYVLTIAHMEVAILGIYLLRGNFLSSLSFTAGVASTLVFILIAHRVVGALERARIDTRAVEARSA